MNVSPGHRTAVLVAALLCASRAHAEPSPAAPLPSRAAQGPRTITRELPPPGERKPPPPPRHLVAYDPVRGDDEARVLMRLRGQVALLDLEIAPTDRHVREPVHREAFALVVAPDRLVMLAAYAEDVGAIRARGPLGTAELRIVRRDEEQHVVVLAPLTSLKGTGLAPFELRPIDETLTAGEVVLTVSTQDANAVLQDGTVLFDGTQEEDLGVARTTLALDRGRPAFDRFGRAIGFGRASVIEKDLSLLSTQAVWRPVLEASRSGP